MEIIRCGQEESDMPWQKKQQATAAKQQLSYKWNHILV